MKPKNTSKAGYIRLGAFLLVMFAMIAGMAQWSSVNVSANHPVLVEGNCDSPVPGTTLVSPGTCGDFDGDGRIGTAEDTDGADRIFGTIRAALGTGTGAAAGTGINHNGKIIIVASGRFAESIFIGRSPLGAAFAAEFGGAQNPGNVTIEAAPGVNADIDAVLQGDPAGGNGTRQGQFGIFVHYPQDTGQNRVVTLRNLQVRNFNTGIDLGGYGRINIDNCRLEGNLVAGIRATGLTKVAITNTQSDGNGFRVPGDLPNPGDGLRVEGQSQVRVAFSNFSNNAGAGIRNISTGVGSALVFKVSTNFNNPDIVGNVVVATDHNLAN